MCYWYINGTSFSRKWAFLDDIGATYMLAAVSKDFYGDLRSPGTEITVEGTYVRTNFVHFQLLWNSIEMVMALANESSMYKISFAKAVTI